MVVTDLCMMALRILLKNQLGPNGCQLMDQSLGRDDWFIIQGVFKDESFSRISIFEGLKRS